MSRFLLIHGTWHGGWCWDRLLPILKQRGHEVWAPTLIGLGERAAEATPKTGLAMHVNQISQMILADDLNDLTVVGHSYAGLVMVGVAERVADRVSRMVYLDALVPDHGQSAFDLMPGAEPGFVHAMRSAGSDFLVPPMPPQEFGVTLAADVKWVNSHLTPTPILTHREKVEAPQRKAFKISSAYIECLQFGLGAGFASRARRDGWRVLESDSGHDVMVTNPEDSRTYWNKRPRSGATVIGRDLLMGIAYDCRATRKLAIVVWDGRVEWDEWRAHLQRMLTDPEYAAMQSQITDLRSSTMPGIANDHVQAMIDLVTAQRQNLSLRRVAILAGREWSKPKMAEVGLVAISIAAIVFNEIGTACQWLGVDEVDVAEDLEKVRLKLHRRP